MSGRKSNLQQFKSLSSISMSSDIVSSATNIAYLDNIGVQFNFTGTPVGVFQVQVSADYSQDTQGNILNAGNWIPLALTPQPGAAAVADVVYIDILPTSAPWIRAAYLASSGSGALNCYITGKMV